MLSSAAQQYLANGFNFNNVQLTLSTSTEQFSYDGEGNQSGSTRTTVQSGAAVLGAAAIKWADSTGSFTFNYGGSVITESVQQSSETVAGFTRETTTTYLLHSLTQDGQQSIANATEEATVFDMPQIAGAILGGGLSHSDTTTTTSRKGITTSQSRPPQAVRNNAAYAKKASGAAPSINDPAVTSGVPSEDTASSINSSGGGASGGSGGGASGDSGGDPDKSVDPNNGYSTQSASKIVLALGSAAAERRIEFSLPYAPDDRFFGPSGGPFYSIRSNVDQVAMKYGRVQNRLLLGNRSGISMQLAPERMPVSPFLPIILEANGLSALYRVNGASWAFDANGIIASMDALFWGAVGGTGDFWFPVAPGIVSLPESPTVVDTTPNQILGTVETVGSIPQIVLDAAFPSAIAGDGVQDETNGNFWTYSGSTWVDVGPVPGPTTAVSSIILPYNETAIYSGRIRSIVEVIKFTYSLTLLTEISDIRVRTLMQVGLVVAVDNKSLELQVLPSTETGSLVIPISEVAFEMSGLAPAYEGEPNTIYVDNTGEIALAGQTPTVPQGEALVFNFDGTDGSTTIISSAGGSITATLYGTAALDTSNKKFGTASLYLDGPPEDPTGDWITYDLPQAFGLDDFCVELWIFTPVESQGAIYASPWAISDSCSLDIDYDTGGGYLFYLYDEILETDVSITVDITYGQWQHIALYRNNGTFYIAVDGVVTLSPTALEMDITQTLTIIGEWTTNDGTYAVPTTLIDEMRTTFGSSVYGTTNFTVPAGPF